MSEIEKLMQNAGIEPNIEDCCKLVDKYWENEDLAGIYVCFDHYMKAVCPHNQECTDECKNAYDKTIYPEFTAEKQLELIKFIGLHYGFQMLKNEAFDYIIATKIFVKYELEYKGYGYGCDEAIANLVNNLWQDLTNTEKAEIKRVLE